MNDYSLFKYYKGEENCPFDSEKESSKYKFWHGEKQFSKTQNSIGWENEAKRLIAEFKKNNQTKNLKHAQQYSFAQFGVILYIETLHSKWDPYDTMEWIFDY